MNLLATSLTPASLAPRIPSTGVNPRTRFLTWRPGGATVGARPASARLAQGFTLAVLLAFLPGCRSVKPEPEFESVFPISGPPLGWVVRAWNDVSQPAEGNPQWSLTDRVLTGGEPRGSWLMSDQEYGDFILEFEFLLGERGNSGCALRAPMKGDPAFDGLELQMADLRYNPEAKPNELTGSLYRAVAPLKQVYKPTEWNKYEIACRGPEIKVMLNGELILDLNLDHETIRPLRHDNTEAPPLKDRPRRGHIGFQELSREGSHVQIRNVRLKVLD